MNDLRDLYQEVIFDHNRHPRNFGKLDQANRSADGYNPVCGDHVTLYLTVRDDVIEEVHFDGQGCAISTASASIMTETLKGKSLDEAEACFRHFQALVTGADAPVEAGCPEGAGKLAVLGGVREFPMRVKCATLPWHTFRAAVRQDNQAVTTE